jgi:hypothetical protein
VRKLADQAIAVDERDDSPEQLARPPRSLLAGPVAAIVSEVPAIVLEIAHITTRRPDPSGLTDASRHYTIVTWANYRFSPTCMNSLGRLALIFTTNRRPS